MRASSPAARSIEGPNSFSRPSRLDRANSSSTWDAATASSGSSQLACRKASCDDPDDAVAASQVEDEFARSNLDGLEKEFGPSIDLAAGEDARIGAEPERLSPN